MQSVEQQKFTALLVKYIDRVPQNGIQENQEFGSMLQTIQQLQQGKLLLVPAEKPQTDE